MEYELTKNNLMICFDKAVTHEKKYVAVLVDVGLDGYEIIVNPNENFEKKIEYYMATYDNDLRHKFADVKIVGFTYGDSLMDIEYDLGYCT
jgi:hypothetical protein